MRLIKNIIKSSRFLTVALVLFGGLVIILFWVQSPVIKTILLIPALGILVLLVISILERSRTRYERLRSTQLESLREIRAISKGAGTGPAAKLVGRTVKLENKKIVPAQPKREILQPVGNAFGKTGDSAVYHGLLDGDKELQWQLDRKLIMPYQANFRDEDFVNGKKNGLLRGVRVAAILDDFSYMTLAPDLNIMPVTPQNWRSVFEEFKPELFLCESAWRGYPGSAGHWKGKIYGSINFPYENRKELLEILSYCRANSIPSLFWNKEDPTHFGDRINDFISTASNFDFVATTDIDLLGEYKKFPKVKDAYSLPFGVQSKLFNPMGGLGGKAGRLCFAGSWYTAHVERRRIQGDIFRKILDAGYGLDIYDRYYGNENEYFSFPKEFKQYTFPAVSYQETANLYREYDFGLTINTETRSRTMLARRVFEMIACGCTVVSNDSVAIRELLDGLCLVHKYGGQLDVDRLEELREKRFVSMNKVLTENCMFDGISPIFRAIGLDHKTPRSDLSFVVKVTSFDEAEKAIACHRKYRNMSKRLVLVVAEKVTPHRVQEFYTRYISDSVVVISEHYCRKYDPPLREVVTNDLICYVEGVEWPESAQLSRAISHAIYSQYPVFANAEICRPEVRLSKVKSGVVFKAKNFGDVVIGKKDSEMVYYV